MKAAYDIVVTCVAAICTGGTIAFAIAWAGVWL